MNTQKQFTFLVFVVGYLSTCNGASISMEAPNVTADNEIDEEESMMHSHFDRNQTDQHIMISYNWGDSKELATKIYKRLTQSGYKVWMDDYEMYGDMLDRMPEAVNNSWLVLMFVSRHYEVSHAGSAEAKYAWELRKRIVPIRVQADFSPTYGLWLDFLESTLLYYDFSDGFSSEAFANLLDGIDRNYREETAALAEKENA
ncbi:uncharacterized protein LOC143465851 [Clavelina lepadiformis]|uniref:uncharacterized protein LOC143465851 n=1 Tax=Clavelina lepadiformis TaxID=159417 RepID=UPI0040431C3F